MNDNKHTMSDLYQMQSLPLSAKIRMTQNRINGWVDEFGEDGVYVSFSGGKDSTVLVDIVRNVCGYKNIPLVVNATWWIPETCFNFFTRKDRFFLTRGSPPVSLIL